MEPASVSIAQLVDLRNRLDLFTDLFSDCIKTAPSRRHFKTYVAGQTSNLERKSIEPIALEAGVKVRTLQEFMEMYEWDEGKVRSRVQQIVMREHGAPDAIGIIDETGMAKKGVNTVGVQRQYCGSTGKIDNCVMTVHLGYATDGFASLIDGDLYLPQENWAENRSRCRAAGIPDKVAYRPKWQIALDLMDRAQANGVSYKFLVADSFYGRTYEFREGVAARDGIYVVEIPCNLEGWTQRPWLSLGVKGGLSLAEGQSASRRVDGLWDRGGPAWRRYRVKETEKGPVVWDVRFTPFFPRHQNLPPSTCRLLVARNVLDGEVKYFLSNAPDGISDTELVQVSFSRARIEQLFRDAKGQIGYDHFEVRNHLPFQRHIVMSMVSQLFLMQETARLREKKPMVECWASTRSGPGAA